MHLGCARKSVELRARVREKRVIGRVKWKEGSMGGGRCVFVFCFMFW